MSLTASERETVISWSDDDEQQHISTGQRTMITQLRKNPNFEEISYDEKFNYLIGTLPLGSITVRKAARGTIKRSDAGTKKRTLPNVAKCGHIKDDGKACQAIATKATGKCIKHPPEK